MSKTCGGQLEFKEKHHGYVVAKCTVCGMGARVKTPDPELRCQWGEVMDKRTRAVMRARTVLSSLKQARQELVQIYAMGGPHVGEINPLLQVAISLLEKELSP